MKSMATMSREEMDKLLQRIARTVDKMLPDDDHFILVTLSADGRYHYTSLVEPSTGAEMLQATARMLVKQVEGESP